MNDLDLVGYEEAAAMLHCSKKSLERAVQHDELAAYRPGKLVLFKRSDLLRWLESRQLQPKVRRSRRKPVVVSRRCNHAR